MRFYAHMEPRGFYGEGPGDRYYAIIAYGPDRMARGGWIYSARGLSLWERLLAMCGSSGYYQAVVVKGHERAVRYFSLCQDVCERWNERLADSEKLTAAMGEVLSR